jgi:hypothetical protein
MPSAIYMPFMLSVVAPVVYLTTIRMSGVTPLGLGLTCNLILTWKLNVFLMLWVTLLLSSPLCYATFLLATRLTWKKMPRTNAPAYLASATEAATLLNIDGRSKKDSGVFSSPSDQKSWYKLKPSSSKTYNVKDDTSSKCFCNGPTKENDT